MLNKRSSTVRLVQRALFNFGVQPFPDPFLVVNCCCCNLASCHTQCLSFTGTPTNPVHAILAASLNHLIFSNHPIYKPISQMMGIPSGTAIETRSGIG